LPLGPGSVLYTHNLTKGDTMSKVKSWAWDMAEEQVDDIIKAVKLGKITKEQAEIDISNVQNLELLGIDEYNIMEVIESELAA